MSDSATSHDDDPTSQQPDAVDPAALVDETFELRSPAPVRALGIASAAAVAGAVVIVLSSHPAVTALGAVVLGLGLLLAVVALGLAARLRSTVRVDGAGLEVSRGSRKGRLAWADIDRVQESRHQLVALARGDERDLVITLPGPRGSTYARLLDSLKLRLDKSRGYGS